MKNDIRCVELVFDSGDFLSMHSFDFATIQDEISGYFNFNKVTLEECEGAFYSEIYKTVVNWNKVCYVREIANCENKNCQDYQRASEDKPSVFIQAIEKKSNGKKEK